MSEQGQWSETTVGTPELASPLLANIYLISRFDLWGRETWRKKVAEGGVIVVRYADDLVVGFESRTDAEPFLEQFRERLASFGLAQRGQTPSIEFATPLQPETAGRGKAEDLHVPGFHALLRETQEREGLRLSLSPLFPVPSGVPPKLNQSGLVRV